MRIPIVSLLALSLFGCHAYVEPTGGYYAESDVVTVAPPEPVFEAVGPPPYAGAVWTAGYWDWRAGRHFWIGGHWATPPRPGLVYVPPTWERRAGGWGRAPSRWIAPSAADRYGRRVWIDSAGRRHYL
jgi:hypothetical protein